jgi:hypothetical protein
MNSTTRYQETLRRPTMIDEACVEDQARLALEPAGTAALDARTAAVIQLAQRIHGVEH